MTRTRAALLLTLVVGWSFAVGAGLQRIWRYETTPGTVQATPASWPQRTAIHRTAGVPTLVMFVHPQCSCTRASLTELQQLMARNEQPLTAAVLFLKPTGESDSWAQSSTWKQAHTIPGITVGTDLDGSEAHRFGATTSGHLIAYGADGHLLYSGGITGSRGHIGDNSHLQDAMLALQTGKPRIESDAAPVFGCSIHDRVTGT